MSFRVNKKIESLRFAGETIPTQPKEFYAAFSKNKSERKNSLVRTGKKMGFRRNTDQVGRLFKGFEAHENIRINKSNNNERNIINNKIKFEEKNERKRMAEYMKWKKEQKNIKNKKKNQQEYLKDWKWEKMCGHCDKPKVDRSKNIQTQTKRRFASKSKSIQRQRKKSRSIEKPSDKHVQFFQKKHTSNRSINSRKSNMSRNSIREERFSNISRKSQKKN